MDVTLQEAGKIIEQAQHLVISSHVNPDGDNVGSTLALYHCLTEMGKKVQVVLDDTLPDNLGMMTGLDVYTRPEGSPIKADLLIIVDVDLDRIGRVREFVEAPVLNLDHHVSNKHLSDYCYVENEAAATAEIVYKLIIQQQWPLNQLSATCLYTGLCSDTGFFKYSNTKPETLRAAAHLLECGAQPAKISSIFEARTLGSVLALGRAIETIRLFHEGKIAFIYADEDLMKLATNTEGFVDYARNIRGVDVAVFLKYIDDNTTRVSMRSHETDVAAICQSLDGGGHIRAAGATVHAPLAEAQDIVLAAIERGMV